MHEVHEVQEMDLNSYTLMTSNVINLPLLDWMHGHLVYVEQDAVFLAPTFQ